MKKTNGWLIGAILLFFCFIIQFVGTVRYYLIMSDDYIGIIIFGSACIFFGIGAFGFFINWKKED